MSLQFLCCVQDDGHSSVEQQQTQRQDEQDDDDHFFCLKLFTTPQTVHHLVILLLLLSYICATDAFDGGNRLLEVPPILQARKPLFNTSHLFIHLSFALQKWNYQLLSHDSADVKERLTLTFWCQWCDTYSEHLVAYS